MSKWNYLVIDEDGDLYGTNDDKLAIDIATNWDTHLVWDTVAGQVIEVDGSRSEIKEITAPEEEEDDEENDE